MVSDNELEDELLVLLSAELLLLELVLVSLTEKELELVLVSLTLELVLVSLTEEEEELVLVSLTEEEEELVLVSDRLLLLEPLLELVLVIDIEVDDSTLLEVFVALKLLDELTDDSEILDNSAVIIICT